MTTDELRTWMKALEERDVKIVALEKRLTALEQQPAKHVTFGLRSGGAAGPDAGVTISAGGRGGSAGGCGHDGRALAISVGGGGGGIGTGGSEATAATGGDGATSPGFGIYEGGYYARRLEFKAGDRWKPQATPGPCAHLTDAQLVSDWAKVYPKFEWRIAPVEPE